jgi:hypothetical protein
MGTHPKRTFPFSPDLLIGPEHGLLKRCDFKTTRYGSRQLSIEHSSPDRWDTAALDSANFVCALLSKQCSKAADEGFSP